MKGVTILEKAKRLKELGEEYSRLLEEVEKEVKEFAENCEPLFIEDSLLPIYSVSGLKVRGIIAFPYRCNGIVGYVVIGEDGKIYFEDINGNFKILYSS
jgi:hypothetical protein